MSTPLEEAPFETYLKILKQEGYEREAEESRLFYVSILTQIDLGDGKRFTEEQIMKTSFKNLVAAIQRIIDTVEKEMSTFQLTKMSSPSSLSGKMMMGNGAEKLSPTDLQRLMMRQSQTLEEEKLRLAIR